jgi:hypothetical protein
MTEFAEGRYFHPRLTNLGGGDYGASLPLPRIPVAPLDEEEEERPRAPKESAQLLAKLSEVLKATDVSYL